MKPERIGNVLFHFTKLGDRVAVSEHGEEFYLGVFMNKKEAVAHVKKYIAYEKAKLRKQGWIK